MTRKDHRIIFTALGLLAIVLCNDIPEKKSAWRATNIARLIESFCDTKAPDAFNGEHLQYGDGSFSVEEMLERYIAELRQKGSANALFDRKPLLAIYELHATHKIYSDQKEFYASAHDDVIASGVLQPASKKIDREAV